jgi:hypothetical protein
MLVESTAPVVVERLMVSDNEASRSVGIVAR